VITISEGIRDVLVIEGVPAGKIRCVPSAVEARIYSRPCDKYWFRTQFGLDEGDRVCGVVAQFIERKGHRYLLRAVPEILAAVPAVRLLLFGKGPLEGELRSLCRELGIQDRVIFAGFREDLPRIMGCLDLVIHPALMEGLGVSLLQAAAAGIPIVATRVGGIPEIVTHQVNGFLVPPSDVAALTRATVRILGDHDLGQAMGDQGRRIVRDRFSIQTMVEGNLAVYSEIVRGRSIIQSLT
ncbi:MAG: glycosyltransferase family 4 protein, partial [bacterium]